MEPPNYDITRTIGSGAFGFVFEAVDRKTKKKVALKRIQKIGKGMSRQNEMLLILKGCPNIIQIDNIFYTTNNQQKLIQNIVFEYLDDNLENIIQKQLKRQVYLQESLIKDYIYQILNGVKYIHQKKIAHRDLKPENTLINKQGILKICDFGCSKVIDPNGKNTPYVMSQYYRAPELTMGINKYSVAVDLWSVGCIMAQLATLDPIFKGSNDGDQLFAILKVMGSFTPQEQKIFKKRVPFDSKMFESFRGYKQIDFNKYFGMLKDKKQFIDLLRKLLAYIPEERITPQEALEHPYFRGLQEEEMLDESQSQF